MHIQKEGIRRVCKMTGSNDPLMVLKMSVGLGVGGIGRDREGRREGGKEGRVKINSKADRYQKLSGK